MQEHLHINREGSDTDSLFVVGGCCVLMLYISMNLCIMLIYVFILNE